MATNSPRSIRNGQVVECHHIPGGEGIDLAHIGELDDRYLLHDSRHNWDYCSFSSSSGSDFFLEPVGKPFQETFPPRDDESDDGNKDDDNLCDRELVKS